MDKVIKTTLVLAMLAWPLASLAFSPPPQPSISTTLDVNQIIDIFLTIFWLIIMAFVIIAFILSIFLGATSGGDPTKTGQARQAAIWGVVGVAVILLSYAIVSIVRNALAI